MGLLKRTEKCSFLGSIFRFWQKVLSETNQKTLFTVYNWEIRVAIGGIRNLACFTNGETVQVDIELISNCIKKSRKAQYKLYQKCYGLLLGICLRYERNKEDADHVLNKAFLKILNSLDRYDLNVPFEAWIRKIMINTLIDEYRRKKKYSHVITIDELGTLASHSTVVDFNEATKRFDEQDLLKLLDNLPTVSKQVFNLFAIDGYPHKEIASMLNISEGTSKWHVSFARKKLKELLEAKLEREAARLRGT